MKKLWEYLTIYSFLPRLANFSVLEAVIRAGVASDEAFAIASGISGERYSDLKINTTVLDVYPSDYLLKVIIALKQINLDMQARQASGNNGGSLTGGSPFGMSGGQNEFGGSSFHEGDETDNGE